MMAVGQEDIHGTGSERAHIRGSVLQPVAGIDEERPLRSGKQREADAHRVGDMENAREYFLTGEHAEAPCG